MPVAGRREHPPKQGSAAHGATNSVIGGNPVTDEPTDLRRRAFYSRGWRERSRGPSRHGEVTAVAALLEFLGSLVIVDLAVTVDAESAPQTLSHFCIVLSGGANSKRSTGVTVYV